MQIPLDYYRILGLPVQASHEQLQQAYRDRTMQLPRREYSDTAIATRKQLLATAYTVLSEPEQRVPYDASYLAHTYNSEALKPAASKAGERSELLTVAVAPHTPSIEIPNEQFVGALLILQELGEYELVLKLGRPYLSSSISPDGGRSEPDQVRSDIVLIVALACLELGRERWQQGQYENAATSLQLGQELLLREGLFSAVQSEIQADLHKLRPYRILELLAQPEETVTERRQGLQLLQKLLQERGGIDGTGEDGSGLTLDDFLRFIQQLRSYLTVAEQQSLFEVQSQPPSAITTYLAVYALIAQGFTRRMPASISRAKLLLLRLGKHQNLQLEQAVCSLLLGQTQQANHALELSQEYETLAFIREHSQGSPDLLPGLCLYSERWLQTEVFPHFRDLAQQQASLKDYFADEQVQAYLEALPAETEANLEAPQSFANAQATTSGSSGQELLSPLGDRSLLKQRVRDKAQGMQTPSHRSHAVVRSATAILSTNSDGVSVVPAAARISGATANHQTGLPNPTTPTKNYQPQRSKRRKRSGGLSGILKPGETFPRRRRVSNLAFSQVLAAKRTRLVLLVVAGLLGIAALGFLVKQTLLRAPSWQKQQPSGLPVPSRADSPPALPQTSPVRSPSPILPSPSSNPRSFAGPLTPENAQALIQAWLSTKAAAFGAGHNVEGLKQILAEPALSEWQRLVQNDKAANQYLQYNERSLKVNSVKTNQANPNKAQVEATVNEVAQVYKDGKLNRDSSYDKSLQVRYDLVRQDDQWRITEINS